MDPHTTTPRKARRREMKGESAVTEDHDDGEEPTPRQHPLSAMPLMSPTSMYRSLVSSSPSRTSTSSHSASIASTESRKWKRSTSPSKQRLELNQYAEYALRQRAWGRVDELPEDMRDLAASMQLISKGRRVLSSKHVEWEQEVGSGITEEDQLIFAKQGVREETGDVPDLSSVVECYGELSATPSATALNPHGIAASTTSFWIWHIVIHDILMVSHGKTSRIYPTSLLETKSTQGNSSLERAESKRVDFCIALNMDSSLGKQLSSKGVLQLNHTDYGGTRYNPISVSIKTKAGAEAGADATLQLTTWVAAQNAFLRRVLQKLGSPNVTIPPLPLVMIQGHQWNFYYAQMKTDSTTLWYGSDAFGNTSTLLGIYRIVAGLQRLMQWAETVYKPWFTENITGPLLES
ncbi:hypothetical protein LTR49_027510 [Elasticomyces elasticus]|nr:hypothetical protein LTR49_027510 [Elasticomyces elasticus]